VDSTEYVVSDAHDAKARASYALSQVLEHNAARRALGREDRR
jgi:hypothetical protein